MIGAIGLLVIWGFFIGPIRRYVDWPIGGIIGVIVAALIAYIFFRLMLWLAGPHVLPVDLHNHHEKAAAWRVLLRFARGLPTLTAVVREGAVIPGPDNQSRNGAGGIGVIDVDSTSVVALATETGLSRIRGQSLVFTKAGEKIGQVIDLRYQLRSEVFDFTTRDGILIRTRITVRFQIDQVQPVQVQMLSPTVHWPRPFTWTSHTIKRALGQQSVTPPDTATTWDKIPLSVAARKLRTIIAEYTFDGLSEPHEPRQDPRAEIKTRLEREVHEALARTGIHVFNIGVGMLFPKDFNTDATTWGKLDKITEQRVKAWQAEWQSRMIRINAEGQAESERRRGLAHIQAQMELIMRVTQALEQGIPAMTETQDQIVRRFLETLQNIANETGTRALLREASSLASLQIMQNMLEQSGISEQREPSTES